MYKMIYIFIQYVNHGWLRGIVKWTLIRNLYINCKFGNPTYKGVSRIQRFGGAMQVILVAKGRDDLPACSGAPLMLCNHTFDKVAIGMFKHSTIGGVMYFCKVTYWDKSSVCYS